MKKVAYLFVFVFLFAFCLHVSAQDIIYAGTNSLRGSKGLYVFTFDKKNSKLSEIQTVSDGESPNFLALSTNRKVLYAVYSKSAHPDGKPSVIAYRIDTATGKLSKLNEEFAGGAGPAHVSVDPKNRFVYVSYYGSGTITVFPLTSDGSLSAVSDELKHSGSSIVQGLQEAPHVHSAIPSADGNFLYVSDLGIDKIVIYNVTANGKLVPAQVPFAQNTAGAGPRHFAIHPNGNFAYSAEELTSTIAAFTVDQVTGSLNPLERVNMLPDGFNDRNSAADIHFSPDGNYLYASNRGHESLVIFSVDSKSGKLTLVGHENTGGKHPRNFMIDKKGEYVLTANRDTDNIVIFKRDKKTGKLTATGEQVKVPAVIALQQL